MTHVASDLAYLVQTEFRLARAEMGEKLSVASNAGAYLAAGGVVALGGLIALLFDIARWITVAGLSYEWSLLIVALVALAIGEAISVGACMVGLFPWNGCDVLLTSRHWRIQFAC